MPAYMFSKMSEKEIEKIMKYFSKELSNGTITNKEYVILEQRIKYKKTQEEIGLIFDVTRGRIRQIEDKADRRLHYKERKKRLEPLIELFENTSR
jgi:DNA-directed RNA polymerase sigma subunit (sigma70/sigma32)